MTIRRIRDDETDALSRATVAVYTDLWRPRLLPEDYLDELADVRGRADEEVVFVAVDDEDGTVLGGITYVGPGRWASIERADQAELRMLAVVPEAKGRGLGAALVQACIDQARLDGKRQIALHRADFMAAAKHIYERAGFVRRPERDLDYDGIPLLGYVLDLDG